MFRHVLFVLFVTLISNISVNGSVFYNKQTGTQDTVSFKSPFYEDNERCFKCHGQNKYEYNNENLGRHG